MTEPVRHLYVHLPFCASRCGYCAFVVEVGGLGARDDYLDAVLGELDAEGGRLGEVETVFLGGGTPTLMRPRRLGALLDRVSPLLAPGAEITVEANPETVDRRQLAELRDAGVTRLSLGVQSFQPTVLRALDRAATPDMARSAFACAREAGFASLSIDLLFGVPGQEPAHLAADIDAALELDPDHISWYELELKPGSALAGAAPALPDEDEVADAYRDIVRRLEGAGYRWYETANHARPGHECRHNMAYWGAADYLGLGIGAVSTVGGRRWRNAPRLEEYVERSHRGEVPRRTVEIIDDAVARRERWMLGLRLDGPLDLGWAGPPDHPEAVDRLAGLGLVEADDGELRLTREGRFVQNAVLGELMEFA
ncbi:MAG: radical SAM family heme chaperone HemW [Miltoncostaeaceae bacterium]